MKKIISTLTLSALLVMSGCQSTVETEVPETSSEESQSYSVVASFYPAFFFTSQVLGETSAVELTNLIPAGGEPHTYEPSPSQLAQMESADLIVVQGEGMEPWLEGLEHELEDNGVEILALNDHLDLLSFEEEHEDHDEHEGHDDHGHEDHDHEEEHEDHDDHGHDDHHDHDHGEYDPHTWLDPLLVVKMVGEIKESLINMDPANAEQYEENANRFVAELGIIHQTYERALASCELDAFITSHDAFAYLAERYGLHVHAVSGVSPFDEPAASQLAELIEVAQEEKVKHIFFEVLANPEAAEVLAEEAGLTSLILNPIAGLAKDQQEEDYFSLMQENLDNLKIGLACE